jgi:hypothetical protein
MADPQGLAPDDPGLDFAAQNNHDLRCGRPPRLPNNADPGLYRGYFENRYGEQVIFTFDRATGAGAVWGGDLGGDEPPSFTLALVDEALRGNRSLAAQVARLARTEAAGLPVIDSASASGRLTGLAGKDETIWLRACLISGRAHERRRKARVQPSDRGPMRPSSSG